MALREPEHPAYRQQIATTTPIEGPSRETNGGARKSQHQRQPSLPRSESALGIGHFSAAANTVSIACGSLGCDLRRAGPTLSQRSDQASVDLKQPLPSSERGRYVSQNSIDPSDRGVSFRSPGYLKAAIGAGPAGIIVVTSKSIAIRFLSGSAKLPFRCARTVRRVVFPRRASKTWVALTVYL